MRIDFSGESNTACKLKRNNKPTLFRTNKNRCAVSRAAFAFLQPPISQWRCTAEWDRSVPFSKGLSLKPPPPPPYSMWKFSKIPNEQKKLSGSSNEVRRVFISRRELGRYSKGCARFCLIGLQTRRTPMRL